MAAKTVMSVDEYLHTAFDGPDPEYVDGEIVERNVGELFHSAIQTWLIVLLRQQAKQYGAKVRAEARVRTTETRFRVPDIGVWRSTDDIVRGYAKVPPFLAVEILSPDDRMSRVVPKIQEYFQWGVDWVWSIDPDDRIGLVYSREIPLGESVSVLKTLNPTIEIPLETALNPED